MLATIQATLFNAHFRTDVHQPVFTPEMFMPGYKAPVQDWKSQQSMLKQHAQRAAKTAGEMEKRTRAARERHRLAAEARARGASAQEIRDIMEGKLSGA